MTGSEWEREGWGFGKGPGFELGTPEKCNYALMRPLFSRMFVATTKIYIYIYILLETSHWISDLEIEYIQIYFFIIYLNVFYFNFTFFNPYI